MKNLTLITGLSLLLLTGCAQKPAAKVATPAPSPATQSAAMNVKQPELKNDNRQSERMQECRSELEAMQVYNKASWIKYNTEIQRLTNRINKYRKVQAAISNDINEIVMPQTEFHMRELCFRIKSRLTQLMIRQP